MKFIILFLLFSLFVLFFKPVFAEGEPKAIELKYFDSNGNNKIDKIEIKFNETLTGSFIGNGFAIDSDTGGLSGSDVKYTESRNGLNKTGEIIDGNILSITFDEYEKSGTGLIIDNTGSSHLRIKTYTDIGVTDLDGNLISIGLGDVYLNGISYGSFFLCEGTCTSMEVGYGITGFENQEFKIPVVVKNFSDIGGFEVELNYDKNNFICSGIDSENIKNYGSLNLSSNQDLGVLNLIWDYGTDSSLNLSDNEKLLDFNCVTTGNIGDSGNIILKINELGDNLGNKLNYNSENISTFVIQENIKIEGNIKDKSGELFSGGKLVLENKSISLNNIFNKVSDNLGYAFDFLTKNQDYEIKVEADKTYTDDLVDVGDIIKIQRYIVGADDDFSGYDCAASDVNQDDSVSVLDVIKLRRYLAGIEDLPSGNLKFYSNEFNCGNLSSKSEKIEVNNLTSSLSNFTFTKVRMGNIE